MIHRKIRFGFIQSILSIISIILLPAMHAQANWPQWRGPNLNGSADVATAPEQLDDAAQLWRIPFLAGAATPIVWGNHIFLSGIDKQGNLAMAAIDLSSGKQLWSQSISPNQNSDRNNLASISAVTDGRLAIFSFGSGDMLATDFDGKIIWKRNLQKEIGKFSILHFYSASPLLWENKLFIPAIHRDTPQLPSFILCLDPATGTEIWRQNRATPARGESKESYTTPMPWVVGGRKELLIAGGGVLTGHNPQTGQELWRTTDWSAPNRTDQRIVPTPLVCDDLLVICAPQHGAVLGFKAPALGADAIAPTWKTTPSMVSSDAPTPTYYQKKVYLLDGDFQKGIHCLNPATGEREWYGKLDSKSVLRGAPTVAAGKIYCTNEEAELFVLSALDGKLLFHRQLENTGQSRATIVALEGKILIRTNNSLYLFGK